MLSEKKIKIASRLTIGANVAAPTAFDTSVLLGLEHAGEAVGDEGVSFEVRRRCGRRCASSDGKHVHELEDEEAGESAA